MFSNPSSFHSLRSYVFSSRPRSERSDNNRLPRTATCLPYRKSHVNAVLLVVKSATKRYQGNAVELGPIIVFDINAVVLVMSWIYIQY